MLCCVFSLRALQEAEYHMCRGEPSGFDPVTLAPASATDDAVVASDPMMGDAPIGNVNLRYGSSCPVNEFPPSATGFYDTHGNVWEWVRKRAVAAIACASLCAVSSV